MLSEHSMVVLSRDVADAGLRNGDVGAIVQICGDGKAYEVEFVDGEGSTVGMVILDAQDIRPIAAGELLRVRRWHQPQKGHSETHFPKWSDWLARIESDQLLPLLINRHKFSQFVERVAPYAGTTRSAELAHWIAQNYVAFAATGIRRMTEQRNQKWRSISLVILLEDMAANDTILTRQRYRELYSNSAALPFADRHFNDIARSETDTHITAHRIKADIDEIKSVCESVERLVNKVVAHTEEDLSKIRTITYGEIHQAIDLLETVFQRYALLVRGKVCEPLVPLDDIDVRGDLRKIWP